MTGVPAAVRRRWPARPGRYRVRPAWRAATARLGVAVLLAFGGLVGAGAVPAWAGTGVQETPGQSGRGWVIALALVTGVLALWTLTRRGRK